MRPQPFPKPGERLVDPIPPGARHESRPARPISIFGGVGYGPAHPSRWAGARRGGTSRLTVENDAILIKPYWFDRTVLRMPAVTIPIAEIAAASLTTFWIWFHVPGHAELDGTRFAPLPWATAGPLDPLVKLLRSRGIPVDSMPVSSRLRNGMSYRAVAARPGLIWRDRGRLGVIESVAGLVISALVLYAFGFFSSAPTIIVVLYAILAALVVLGWFVGARRRKHAIARFRDRS